MERGLYNRDLDIVFPKEGSFSFDISVTSQIIWLRTRRIVSN